MATSFLPSSDAFRLGALGGALSAAVRIERSLALAVDRATAPGGPAMLRDAIHYAVFPGGARLRPSLCLAAAAACGDARPDLTDASAAAVELVHCASLVHDDLPCFDDADLRRGRPAVHKVYGEPIALLVGDALIVHAFETLARAGSLEGALLLAKATGAQRGIIAGQAWESEPVVDVDEYHRAKTASLFAASAALGAASAGAPIEPWIALGEAIGRAYQAADDLADVASSPDVNKTPGRDALLNRPSAVSAWGAEGARERLHALLADVDGRIPLCPGQSALRAWLRRLSSRIGVI